MTRTGSRSLAPVGAAAALVLLAATAACRFPTGPGADEPAAASAMGAADAAGPAHAAGAAGRAEAAGAAAAAAALPAFELEDQEGRAHRYAPPTLKPVVILVGDGDAAECNTLWDKWLAARFGEAIEIYRVVDLSSVPRIAELIVAGRIRKGADPPGVPILLDWDGLLARAARLQDGVTTVLAGDRQGAIKLWLSAAPDEAATAKAAAAIEELLELRDG